MRLKVTFYKRHMQGSCPSLVLLDRVAFDTVNYSVLLDCLHDCADVIPSSPKLLRQRSNSHLQPQIPVIARPLIRSAVHFCSVNAFGLWYVNMYVCVMHLFTYLTAKVKKPHRPFFLSAPDYISSQESLNSVRVCAWIQVLKQVVFHSFWLRSLDTDITQMGSTTKFSTLSAKHVIYLKQSLFADLYRAACSGAGKSLFQMEIV